MPRRAAQQAVTARMYKHFAVFTVLVTGALALATGDGNADTFNSTVDDAQQSVAKGATKLAGHEQPTLARRSTNSSADALAGWGAVESVAETTFTASDAVGFAFGYSHADLARVGLTPEQFDALSPKERERIEQLLTGRTQRQSGPATSASRSSLVAASLARSGASEGCDDC